MNISDKISKEEVEDQFLRLREVFDLNVTITLREKMNIYYIEIISNATPEIKQELSEIKSRFENIYSLGAKIVDVSPPSLRDKEDENKILIAIAFTDSDGKIVYNKAPEKTKEEIEKEKAFDLDFLSKLEDWISEHEKCINYRLWGRENGQNVLIYDPNGDPMTDENVESAKRTLESEIKVRDMYRKKLGI